MTTTLLPASLAKTPSLDRWIRIEENETITVYTGKVEIGQGIKTVIGQIAAEELDVAMQRMNVMLADTELSPDEGYTAGSTSTFMSGGAVRQAAAEVRHILLTMASIRTGCAAGASQRRRRRRDGSSDWRQRHRSGTERRTTSAAGCDRRSCSKAAGRISNRRPTRAALGHTGQGHWCTGLCRRHDAARHAACRVVRPPSYAARLVMVDIEPVRRMAGVVDVVRNGSFLAVAALCVKSKQSQQRSDWLPWPSGMVHRCRPAMMHCFRRCWQPLVSDSWSSTASPRGSRSRR